MNDFIVIHRVIFIIGNERLSSESRSACGFQLICNCAVVDNRRLGEENIKKEHCYVRIHIRLYKKEPKFVTQRLAIRSSTSIACGLSLVHRNKCTQHTLSSNDARSYRVYKVYKKNWPLPNNLH